MSPALSKNVQAIRKEFLESFRLGVDFGDKAHGIAIVKDRDVILGATLQDASESDLSKRNQLRRARRTRASRRQRLMRFRQWCLRNRLPDPDPYFNKQLAEILWPPDREGKPQSAFAGLTLEQRTACRKALLAEPIWQQFLALPPEVMKQCAIVNPFIARRLAREGQATPLVFVRAIWHLFEHRGFDWYNRIREQDDDWRADKGALLRHLKTLVIDTDQKLEELKADIAKRDEEAAKETSRAKPWLPDLKVQEELRKARERGKRFPICRRLNPPRDYVEKELRACLVSLPLDCFAKEFGRKNGQPPLTDEQKRAAVFQALKKLLNWNRREPRFDNRQLRGCTWCAARGIQRNTPRNKNVLEWHIKAAIRDVKVAVGATTSATKPAISSAAVWLDENEFKQLWELVTNLSLSRDEQKEKLDEFFKRYARLPKQVFVKEGARISKQTKPTDPYKWHREELLNLAEGWRRQKTGDKRYRQAKGRARLCVHCLQLKASTPPDQLHPPVGEAEVILSQRALRTRCERLINWLKKNAPPAKFPVQFIRIEAVLPRPEEKMRLKAEAGEAEPDQSPKAKLKFRLMAELGAYCDGCDKPYREQERRGPKSKRDDRFCQCPKPDLHGPCAYCGEEFGARDLQIEHIYPKNPVNIEGGIGPDAQINKTVACDKCNQGDKKDRLPFDYFHRIGGIAAWEQWKTRVRSFAWPAIKKKIALLEEYKLPEEVGDISLARTRLVHRYLRQKLAEVYFPEQIAVLKDPKADPQAKQQAKSFLDWHMSTPAGWMTSRCRLDWEHEKRNGDILPLVPRKSPLRPPEQRQKALERRLAEEPAWKHASIRRGFQERAPIEDALLAIQRREGTAVCDRTNLNHHWIDAAVLASLPPQANQPVELGGLWYRNNGEVRADIAFAPRAAEYLKKYGDGSVIADLQNRSPRFTAQQQETSLYGEFRPIDRPKQNGERSPKKIPKKLHAEAAKLPQEVFEFAEGKLRLRDDFSLDYEQRNKILDAISNVELQKKVRKAFQDAFELTECHVIYKPIENLKVQDKDLIVSQHWRTIFSRLCEAEYDFPKKRAETSEADEDDQSGKPQKERRKPKEDESLPEEAWKTWANDETTRLRKEGKLSAKEFVTPRHLKIYFNLGPNEKVVASSAAKRVMSKRGVAKPERICRMTSIGSHAVFDREAGTLHVLPNPWKAHVEKTNQSTHAGQKIFKGDCIWLPHGKSPRGKKEAVTGPGWYQVTEMSPAKTKLDGDIGDAKLKVVPAWLDLNQLVQLARSKEPDETKRKKIKRDFWETDIHAANLNELSKAGNLRIKRRCNVAFDLQP